MIATVENESAHLDSALGIPPRAEQQVRRGICRAERVLGVSSEWLSGWLVKKWTKADIAGPCLGSSSINRAKVWMQINQQAGAEDSSLPPTPEKRRRFRVPFFFSLRVTAAEGFVKRFYATAVGWQGWPRFRHTLLAPVSHTASEDGEK